MKLRFVCQALIACLLTTVAYADHHGEKIQVMLLTGQNNHGWEALSARLEEILDEAGMFETDVVVSPKLGEDMSGFKPDFESYDVIVLEYNGDVWPRETELAFERYMENGGGLVFTHAVNHTFKDWKAFNLMMGIGGWGGRFQESGPFVHWRAGKIYLDDSPGQAGACVDAHAFEVVTREPDHPIMKGIPPVWLHGKDELYSNQRGPAENFTILATAYSDPKHEAHWGPMTHGTGEHEPMIFTTTYGKGRTFGTPMGHVDNGAKVGAPAPAMDCEGFITIVQRGTEWAATGKVTQKVPKSFPGKDKVNLR